MSPEPLPAVPRRRVAMAFLALGGGAVGCVVVIGLLAWLMQARSWTQVAPLADPEWGITFSCRYAEYLLLEDPAEGAAGYVDRSHPDRPAWCGETLGRLLDLSGARFLRLSVEWSDVDRGPGRYDWAAIDRQLAEAERRGVDVLMSVGMKSQRHPEYYIPDRLLEGADIPYRGDPADVPAIRDGALALISAAVGHFAGSPAITAWMVENEPFQGSARIEFWALGRDYVREAMAAARAADPAGRPLVLNHSGHWSWDQKWRWAAEGDIVAVNIYPWRNWDLFAIGPKRTIASLELGPISPNWAARRREVAEQPFWITEMQAEPWGDPDIRVFGPGNPAPDMSLGKLRKNVEYSRRTGADRVYLWGSEWWLYQSDGYGDNRWLVAGKAILTGAN
ncbi:MAG: hypothetical protein ACKVVT_02530 [Dehalococcoidia bacterium]